MSTVAPLVLPLAAFLCLLVAGFLFAFSVVVMPGIARLDDREFLRAFQGMDRIIQRGHPLFGLMWMGSVVATLGALALAFGPLQGLERWLTVLAAVVYLGGVQLPTFTKNIPLNNEVQALDVAHADASTLRTMRERFEATWTRWNTFRAVMAVIASALFMTAAHV